MERSPDDRRADAKLLEGYLKNATIYSVEFLNQGGFHQGKARVIFDGGVSALAKPASGVADDIGERVVRSEVGAYLVAREMGFTDLVPVTVYRTIPTSSSAEDPAAVQVLVPEVDPDLSVEGAGVPEHDLIRAAVLDYIIWNSDRGGHNWLVTRGQFDHPRIILIDHGLAFGFDKREFASTFFEMMEGRALPPGILEALERLVAVAHETELAEILPRSAFRGALQRAQQLLKLGKLPERTSLLVRS